MTKWGDSDLVTLSAFQSVPYQRRLVTKNNHENIINTSNYFLETVVDNISLAERDTAQQKQTLELR